MSLKTKFENKVADVIFKLRWIIVAFTVIATIVFIYGFTQLKFAVRLEDMLPPTHPFVQLNEEFGHRFGSLSHFEVEVGVEKGDWFTPKRLELLSDITNDIYFMEQTRRNLVWSITMNKAKEIKGLPGNIFINAYVYPHPPDTVSKCQELKKRILADPIYSGRLISSDGKYALISGNVKENISQRDFFNHLLKLKHKYESKGIEFKMVGRPILMGWIYHFLPSMFLIFAISIVLILGVLAISFRSLQGLVVPFIIGALSSVWGIGFIGLVQMNLNPLMIVLPFAVGIRAISHTVQITARFMEEYARSEDKWTAGHTTAGSMFLPNASAIAAECSAFVFLVAVQITIVQQIALAITFWMIAIWFTTAVFTPILCYILPKPSAKRIEAIKQSWGQVTESGKIKGDIIDKIIMYPTRYFIGRGRGLVIAAMCIVIIGGGYIAFHVKSGDLSPGSPVLYPDSEYNIAADHINRVFDNAGSDVFQIYFDGVDQKNSALAPPVLQTYQKLHYKFLEEYPTLYSGWDSVVPIIKQVNVAAHEGDVKWDFIPANGRMLSSIFGLYASKLVPPDLNKYMDAKTHTIGNVNYYFKNHMPSSVDSVIDTTKEFFQNNDLDTSKYGEFKIAGGTIAINQAINHTIESVHWIIVFGVLTLIFILCALSFRSALGGLLLIIPLIASNAVAFSYMVIMNIGLTINTLPVISVGLGIGVDFGMYLYSRFQEEYQNFNDFESTIITGNITAGKGVLYTALTMIVPLYLWYFISSIRFQGEMGLFLGIILTVNVIAVLIFHPVIVSILRPKFITKMSME